MIATTKPEHLRISTSSWYGTTVYTDKFIKKGAIIASTLSDNYDKIEGHMVTPFGNIFNSSADYNDINIHVEEITEYKKLSSVVKIIASRDIEKGEELLMSY